MVHTNMSENDRFDVEKRNGDLLNYSANWQFGGANFTNSAMDSLSMCSPTAAVKGDLVGSSSCSSAPFVESCCSIPWNHSTNSQNLGFFDQTNAKSSSTQGIRRGSPVASSSVVDKRLDIDWDSPNSVSEGAIFLPKAPGILPQILSQFPADSSFIERAARFSCFNGGGFSDIAIPFSIPESFSHYYRSRLAVQGCGEDFTNEVPISELPEDVGRGSFEGSPLKREVKSESLVMPHDEAKGKIVGSNNESDEAESSGCVGQEEPSTLDGSSAETPAKGLGLKKRRRDSQAFELDLEGTPLILGEVGKENSEIQQNGDQDIIPASNKSTGKQGKPGSQALDAPKEEYIHVRARRGQATNSHSLAERVRREKISERMKFLQDLVPGCSKVTGKAVMLDEIINYVQSLQRQVEFLSMKLATVNPQLELNIEGLLAKDILRSRACSSFKLGFSPDMSINYPRLHPLPPRLVEASLSAMGNNPQPLTTSRPQQPGMWEDELHNVVRMSSFGTSASVGSREFNESLPAEHKIDLR